MFVVGSLRTFDMQRILEGNLLIGPLSVVLGNGLLQGFEIEEIEWVTEATKEFADTVHIDLLRLVQRTFHLHLLLVAQFLFADILKRYTACIVVLQFLFQVHAIEVENGGLVCRNAVLVLTVVEEGTPVWLLTML